MATADIVIKLKKISSDLGQLDKTFEELIPKVRAAEEAHVPRKLSQKQKEKKEAAEKTREEKKAAAELKKAQGKAEKKAGLERKKKAAEAGIGKKTKRVRGKAPPSALYRMEEAELSAPHFQVS